MWPFCLIQISQSHSSKGIQTWVPDSVLKLTVLAFHKIIFLDLVFIDAKTDLSMSNK